MGERVVKITGGPRKLLVHWDCWCWLKVWRVGFVRLPACRPSRHHAAAVALICQPLCTPAAICPPACSQCLCGQL